MRSVFAGDFNKVEYTTEPYFVLSIPVICPDVSNSLL